MRKNKKLRFHFIELIASTISRLLSHRWESDPLGYVTTEHRYDVDMNRLDDPNGPFQTPTYAVASDTVPATQFEKIFWMICTVPMQAVLLYHQAIQGTVTLFITVFRIVFFNLRYIINQIPH